MFGNHSIKAALPDKPAEGCCKRLFKPQVSHFGIESLPQHPSSQPATLNSSVQNQILTHTDNDMNFNISYLVTLILVK